MVNAAAAAAPKEIADLACPLCSRHALDLAGAKVVDLESVRIVPVLTCWNCEYAEELAVLLGERVEI